MLVHASPRSAISRAALAEILRTMSFDLCPGDELEIALIGKKPPEMQAILAEPANVERMREALARFAGFIEAPSVAVLTFSAASAFSISRHQLVAHRGVAQRADMLERDLAVLADDEGLRHAVDAPVDARAARRIDADRRIGIAELAEEFEAKPGLSL